MDQVAADAQMKYLVITARHHDGFSMFGSRADRFNIVDATPFQRDPVKELAGACAKRGIRFGVYYSQAQNSSAPGGAIWEGPHEDDPVWKKSRWDVRQEGDFETYFHTKAIPQVRELLSNDGPISIVWFDTPLNVMTVERAALLEKTVRGLQPDCLISGRLGGDRQSDYEFEGDNAIPELSRSGAWETPATLNDTWGFEQNDHHWKKPETLIFKLADIVSKGGNYLLHVGSDGEGAIPQPSQDILRAVGSWLKVNGESIYEADGAPFGKEFGEYSATQKDRRGKPVFQARTDWRCTTKPGKLYLHLFKWPNGVFELTGVQRRVSKAYLLAESKRVPPQIKQKGNQVSVVLPKTAPDRINSVVCLELSDERGPHK